MHRVGRWEITACRALAGSWHVSHRLQMVVAAFGHEAFPGHTPNSGPAGHSEDLGISSAFSYSLQKYKSSSVPSGAGDCRSPFSFSCSVRATSQLYCLL